MAMQCMAFSRPLLAPTLFAIHYNFLPSFKNDFTYLSKSPVSKTSVDVYIFGQPIKTLIKAISSSGRCRLYVPRFPNRILSNQSQLPANFRCTHGIREILFVGIHQERCISQLILVQQTVQFFSCSCHSFPIVGIDDEDNAIDVIVVMLPKSAKPILSSDIPYSEGYVSVLN